MKTKGKVVVWNDERGFGFVESIDGERRAFLHISQFKDSGRPCVGLVLLYDEVMGKKGLAAESAEYSIKPYSVEKPVKPTGKRTFAKKLSFL